VAVPPNVIAARSGAGRWCIVAADIAFNAPATSSLTSNSPKPYVSGSGEASGSEQIRRLM